MCEWPLAWRATGAVIEQSPYGRKNVLLIEDDAAPSIIALDPDSGTEVWRSPELLGGLRPSGVHFVNIGNELRLTLATEGGFYLTR